MEGSSMSPPNNSCLGLGMDLVQLVVGFALPVVLDQASVACYDVILLEGWEFDMVGPHELFMIFNYHALRFVQSNDSIPGAGIFVTRILPFF